MDDALNRLGGYLTGKLGPKLTRFEVALDELTIDAKREQILDVIRFLKEDERCPFGCPIDPCAVAPPARAGRSTLMRVDSWCGGGYRVGGRGRLRRSSLGS